MTNKRKKFPFIKVLENKIFERERIYDEELMEKIEELLFNSVEEGFMCVSIDVDDFSTHLQYAFLNLTQDRVNKMFKTDKLKISHSIAYPNTTINFDWSEFQKELLTNYRGADVTDVNI